jgi:hypothetical protein
MSEPSGYRDSPETTDPATSADEDAGLPPRADDVPLTTDDEAQRDDSVTRPGNEPD